MSISLKKSFLCLPGLLLLISILVTVGVENNNIHLLIKMEYPVPTVYGQGEDGIDTDNVENREEIPQQLQQDSTDNNNNEDNNGNGNADPSESEQINECPEIITLGNTPMYVDQDGCQHPCPSPDSNDQSNIPEGCMLESPSQSSAGFSINEERPIQPQQNVQSNPSQNTFASPRIDNDSITSNISNTEATTTTTQKSFNPAGQYKPGSEQTELRIPGQSNDPSVPYTPGAGNTQLKGIPVQPNTNPQTPIEPGNIPTKIPDRAHLTVITKMMGFYTNYLKVSDFEICVNSTVQTEGSNRGIDALPLCANGSGSGFKYTVQAPGLVKIWVNNLDELGVKSLMIETPNFNNYISAHESKTSTVYISPFNQQ